MGDFEKSYSIFSKNKLLKSFEIDEAESIGRCLTGQISELNNVTGHWADHAGKLMGLKSYGNINEEYLNLFEDEIFEVQKLMSYRKYLVTNSEVSKNPLNYLSSVHKKLENIVLNFFKKNANENSLISYTGGVAQNSVINGMLKEKFKNLTIPPHCPDDGLSLGLIEFLRQHYNQEPFENTNFPFWQDDYCPKREPSDETILKIAEELAQGKIIGWYQGNGELGPRALGNRSILMNPSILNGKHLINQKVKNREWFRPFGASILEEHTNRFFKCNYKSEYMLYVTEIIDKQKFSSITHVDGTCRIQTVGNSLNTYKRLIDAFFKKTGIPMLLNTSMNVNGNPIASRYTDALHLISHTNLDIVVIGNEIYKK
jgi:carbamoyltransferase